MSHNPKHTESCYYFKKEKHLTWQEMFRPYLLDQALPVSEGIAEFRYHEFYPHKKWLMSQGVIEKAIYVVPTHGSDFTIELNFYDEADEAEFIMRMTC